MSVENQFELTAAFNEYLFAKTVEEMNQARLGSNLPLITVSRGRELHRQFVQALHTAGKTMATATNRDMFQALDNTLRSDNGGLYVFTASPESRLDGYLTLSNQDSLNFYNQSMRDFKASLGWDFSRNVRDARNATGVMPQGGYLPISPYDERYAHRNTILEHGSEILYAPASQILHMVPNVQPQSGEPAFLMAYHPETEESRIPLFSRRSNPDRPDVYVNAGPAYSPDDASGLSRLRPYLSQTDYRDVASWMNNINPGQRMSGAALEKSVAVLQMLQDQGVPYTVSKDRMPGQIKANIGNSKVSIRLTDTRQNERFVGRVYKDGYSLYLMSVNREYSPSTEEMLNCIQYALGESVSRKNVAPSMIANGQVGQEVGSPSSYMVKGNQKATTFTSVGSNGKMSFQTLVGYPNVNGSPARLSIRLQNNHSASYLSFSDQEQASAFLEEAVSSAKENFVQAVDLERLIQEASEHAGDENYTPEYSGNPMIAPIQRDYWDVLTGKKTELYRPDDVRTKELVDLIFSGLDFYEEDDTLSPDTLSETAEHSNVYQGTPEENVRQHLQDSVNSMFGQFEEDGYGKRFNPVLVSSFMTSSNSIYRNNDNMVSAMRTLGFTGDELLGDDFQNGTIRDKLLRYDPESAKPMSSMESPFMKQMYETIKKSIAQTGCKVQDSDILIDRNGVVHYTAQQVFGQKGELRSVEGEIGQIFEPDSQGVVETQFNGSENHLFSPGHMAYVLPQKEGEHLSLEERMRFRGYEQTMAQNLGEQLRYDLMSDGVVREDGSPKGVKVVGTTTSVNNTYRGLYESRYRVAERQPGETLKEAYLREAQMANLPIEVVNARFETNARLVKFPTELKEGSTIDADYKHTVGAKMEDTSIADVTNDNVRSPYELTGRRNLSVMTEEGDGYFDQTATGSSKNQGIIRYAAEGTQFTPDGRLIPTEDKDARTPLMNLEVMKYLKYTPFDRQQMVFSNLMSASGVSDRVGMAQMTLCGKTFDDGTVISKDFAERYGVLGEDGQKRPLVKGDKICDFAGNKCIIADVIDRNMSDAEAKEKNLVTEVELFRANPKLDIVMAPYSATSRFNAGSAKFLMESPDDLVMPDGTVKEGCMGYAPVIITDKKVEEKTKIYDEDDVKSGGGRKISSQLAWAFAAKGATAILDEFYSGNNGAITNFREVLISMGLDMSETGQLRVGYQPHEGEERNMFHLPSMDEISQMSRRDIADAFKYSIDSKGGFLEIPFPLTMPSGEQLQEVPSELSSYPDQKMYAFPILSSYLRSGQEFEDGTSKTHDYTNHYIKIFESAVSYLKAKAAGGPDAAKEMAMAKNDAVMAYGSITDSLKARKFEGKHNAMRDDFMAHRVPHSATAVWTPDPGLNLDEVGMSAETMKTLGMKEDSYVLVWRDPILREEGTRYLKCKQDDSLKGVSVHPLIAVMFDGDFDGDSVGLAKLQRQDAQEEAMRLFSIDSTLLDMTKVNPDGTFKLAINDTMDVKSAEYLSEQAKQKALANGQPFGKTLAERRMDLERKANEIYADKSLSDTERLQKNHEVVEALSDWAHDTLDGSCGTAMVSYKDLKSHGESILEIVKQKAKGSMSKAGDYFKYFGATFEKDPEGNILPETLKDTGNTLATREDMVNTEYATAIKAFGTGIAGSMSQRLMVVGRNVCASPGLRLTYNSTQGVLQSKHDPALARQQYEMLQSTVRHLWRGHAMDTVELTDDDGNRKTHWKPKMEVDGKTGMKKPVQASKDEWIKTFMEIHESPDGMNVAGCVNPAHVREVADALSDPQTGKMYDIESDAVKEKLAAPMDRLAYGGNFDLCVQFAKEGKNIFEGEYNQMFASSQIRKNMQMGAEGDSYRAIVKEDTLSSGRERKLDKRLYEVKAEQRGTRLVDYEMTEAGKKPDVPLYTADGSRRMPDVPVAVGSSEKEVGDYGA